MTAVPSPESLVLLALLTPFVGALIIPLFRKLPNLRETVTLVTAGTLCLAVFCLFGPVLDGARPEAQIIEVAPGLELAFKVEPLGMLFALVASSLWIVNSIYSIGYMRTNNEPRQTTFYVCFAVALGSTIGIAFAKNLFTLFLFYEGLTLSTYPLVTHERNEEAVRAGRIYLLLLLGTSLLLFLPAIIATWVLAGTLDFTPGGIVAGKADVPVIAALLALYVFGIGKAAVMPVHFWLPAAMVAPTPVSALLHAVAVVKAGVFTVVKVVVYVFGIDTLTKTGANEWLIFVASASLLIASFIALSCDNLKARLAYSTVSQLAYRRSRRSARHADQHHRKRPPDRHACRRKDYFVLLRGRHLYRPSPDRNQRDDRDRPQDAGYDAGFPRGLAQHHRAAAGRGLEQMDARARRTRCGLCHRCGRADVELVVERGLSVAYRGARILSPRRASRRKPELLSRKRQPPA